MHRVTVVIPVYNSSDTIEKCLNSVLSQTYRDFQILIADDGSTDNCVELIRNFFDLKNFFDYKILSQKNAGPGNARMLAIKHAGTQLCAFIDSDDEWSVDHLFRLVSFFDNNSVDLVCTVKNLKIRKPFVITLNKLLYRCYVQSSTLLAKTEILLSVGFRAGKRYSEDYDLWLRIAAAGYKMVVLPYQDVDSVFGKRTFGMRGLSKQLWRMEKNELENYVYLKKMHIISFFRFCTASGFSFFKYLLRVVRSPL